MRHLKSGKHFARTSAHRIAMRRNLAQSLFEFGEIRTTVEKAKDVRRFVERLITLARDGSLRSRQRVMALLSDRAIIPQEKQDEYDRMSNSQRAMVRQTRSGRRIRTGVVPSSYNKKKVTFVATSVVHKLISEIAPRYRDRPGGYTRIVKLPRRRIGDAGRQAILQLVGAEEAPSGGLRKAAPGRRKQRAELRRQFAEGKIKSRRAAAASEGSAEPPAAETTS